MFSLCRQVMKYSLCDLRALKNIHFSLFHRLPSNFTSIRSIGVVTKRPFNIKDTTFELQKKIDKLSVKLKNGFFVSLHSIDNILTHPCFEASQISKADSLILLSSCELMHEELPEKRAEYIWRIWEKFKKMRVIDLDTYHSLLKALRETGTHVEVKNILHSIETDGLSPTTETYTLLLECACENQNFDDIEFVLSASKKAKCEVTERGFNAILFLTAKSRGLDSAMGYLNSSGRSMNSEICVSLLKGIAVNRDSDCFNRLFTEACKNDVKFSIQNRVSILHILIEKNMNTVIRYVLGSEDDWQTYPMTLCNLIARCTCFKNYPAMFEILKFMGDLVHVFTPSTDELPSFTYVELIITIMVRSKLPANDILQFCLEGDSALRLKRAAYSSLRNGFFDYSLIFFEAMKSIDLPLRPHYFWPMFLSSRDDQEIFNVISKMQQFGVELDHDTLHKYIFKRLWINEPTIVEKLEEFGIPIKFSVTPLVATALQKKLFQFAIDLCQKYKSEIDYKKLYFLIASSSLQNQDFNTVSEICLSDNNHLYKVFHNLMFHFKNLAHPSFINNFLNTFRRNKIGLFRADLNELRSYVNVHHLNEEIWLRNLVNETNDDSSSSRPHLRDMNIDELEDYVVHLRKNNYCLRQALRRLLIMHAEKGNIDRVIELKQELEQKRMEFSLGMKIAVLKIFCLQDQFSQAYDLFLEMKSNGSHEKLKGEKFLLLASVAAKKNDLGVMYEILKSRTNSTESNMVSSCISLVQNVANHHGVSAADQLLEFLIENNYCQIKINLLKPIIKCYLERNEIENATSACLRYANRFRMLPMERKILRRLAVLTVEEQIRKSKPKFQILLNEFLRTSGYLHGSSLTNITYAICLAESGLLATLRLFLKESCTGIEDKLFWRECDKLCDDNKVQTLINLEKCFKDLHFNVEPIYMNLLKIYCRNKDVSSARALLKSLEDSKRMPSMEFLDMFAELQNGDDIG